MFGDIARFLLNTIFTLFGAALLLRAWLQFVRVPPYNPVTHGIQQATNWLVLPLRRVIPGVRGIDWASVVAALLASIVFVLLMVWLVGVDPLGLWLTILMALLSWLNPGSAAMPVLFQLTAPFLNPLRRILPNFGGLDLSPILLFVIVQVLLMVVTRAAVSLTLFGI
jgi:YggT family protein